MRWRVFLAIGWAALVARAAFAADNEGAARKAVLAVEPQCANANLQPITGGFVACCEKNDVTRCYYVTISRRKGHLTRLFEHNGSISFDASEQGFKADYEDGDGQRHELLWSLGIDKPALHEEIVRGKGVCGPERYRDHYNALAMLKRPTRKTDFGRNRVRVERELIECKNGRNSVTTRVGLLIPVNGSLEIGWFGADAIPPTKPSEAARLSFTVAARVAAKSLTLQLQPRDDSKNPIVGGDARTGDHFEIWIAPPAPEPTCDELLKMTALCTAPAVVAPPVRIWIGQAADGKLTVATEPRDVGSSVVAKLDGATITVELGGALPASAATGGLAVLYHDQASGATIGTANPEKGNFSLLGEAAIPPPPMEERTVPLK